MYFPLISKKTFLSQKVSMTLRQCIIWFSCVLKWTRKQFVFCFFKDWITVPNDDPCCQECKNKLILVVQLYCPLQGSIYHRTLYLFKCLTCKDGRFVWTKHPIGWLSSVYHLKNFVVFYWKKVYWFGLV